MPTPTPSAHSGRSHRVGALAVAVVLASLGACSSSGADAVHEVHAISVSGEAGVGPRMVPAPASGSGGQQVVLADRVLVVGSTTMTPATDPAFTTVEIALEVRNTTNGGLTSAPADFRLLVAGGDAFSPVAAGAPGGTDVPVTIAAGATWRGSIAFGIPTALLARPQLLFRPAGAADTVLVPLADPSTHPTGEHP